MSYFDNKYLICCWTGTEIHILLCHVDRFHVTVLTHSTNAPIWMSTQESSQKDFYFESKSHHYIVMFCVYYIQIQGLPPLEDPACAVCKGCVLCRPGKPELSLIKWDGSSLQTCPTASLTVPSPTQTLPTLPNWGLNTFWEMSAAFVSGIWSPWIGREQSCQ